VKFSIRHEVGVTPSRAVAAYGSPSFYEGRPARDDIAVRGVVRHEVHSDRVLLEVRFAFTGHVSAAVRAVVDPARLSWVTRTELRPAEARSEWEVRPDHYADRLSARGTYRFEPGRSGPGSTRVLVDGELVVHVPVVGRSVERAIVAGLREYLEDEVAGVAEFAG
jgi:hypothetical protein